MLRRAPGKRGRQVVKALFPVLPKLVSLMWGLIRDGRVGVRQKALLGGALLYVISPLDLIPDFLGIFGWSDDLFLVGLAIREFVLRTGDDVIRDHWTGSEDDLRDLQMGLEDLGALLPGPIRRFLRSYASRW